jgi:predicted Zn finger-like uncharacterized protein
MRLTCPNCGAEYEAPRNMLPAGGRHVQCSACHTRWFARGEGKPAELSEEQIIHRLEARGGPNLRVVEATEAGPWSDAEPMAEPGAVPAETEPATPLAQLGPAPTAAEPDRTPPGLPPVAKAAGVAKAQPADGGAEEFTWESDAPEPDEPSGPAPAGAVATADSAPSAPDANRLGDREDLGLPWSEPSAPLVAPAANPRSPRLDLDRAEAHPAPAPQQSLFVRGFLFATAAFAVLFLAYLLAEPLAERVPLIGPVVGAYGDAVDVLRERIAVAFPTGA